MDEKQGGAPQETPKPNSIENIIEFSFTDLNLLRVDRQDNQRYLVFLVGNEFMITMLEWEYFSYLSFIFETLAEVNLHDFNCISTVPEHELINENVDFKMSLFDENGQEEQVFDKKLKMYYVWDIVPNTFIEIDNQINLN